MKDNNVSNLHKNNKIRRISRYMMMVMMPIKESKIRIIGPLCILSRSLGAVCVDKCWVQDYSSLVIAGHRPRGAGWGESSAGGKPTAEGGDTYYYCTIQLSSAEHCLLQTTTHGPCLTDRPNQYLPISASMASRSVLKLSLHPSRCSLHCGV